MGARGLGIVILAIIVVGIAFYGIGRYLASSPLQTGQAEMAETRSGKVTDAASSTDSSSNDRSHDANEAKPSTEVSDVRTSRQPQSSASNTAGVDDPWIKGGLFTTGDAELDRLVKELCDEQSDPSASAAENAYNTYNYVTNTTYDERVNNQSPWGETWDIEYALQYFEEGYSGNCYNFTAIIEYVLKYFGYSDAEAEPCVVKLSNDDWGDHGLVFVTDITDGESCLVDAARYKEGWMLGKDAYSYDVRNVAQNPTVTGNADVIFDSDNPIPITPAPGLEPTESD